MKKISILLAFVFYFQTQAQIITTVAGDGSSTFGGDNGPATSAQLNSANGMAVDAAGNLYIADQLNNRIRMVNTAGVITTYAGTGVGGFYGDGNLAINAQLHGPTAVQFDNFGNLYVADFFNHCVRKITTAGIITSVAGNSNAGFYGDGGPATAAQLDGPSAIAFDAANNLYIADQNNNRIRMVNSSGYINTVVGNGNTTYGPDGSAATSVGLNAPTGVVVDGSGNIYISDSYNYAVRKVNTSGIITTFAGTGSQGNSGEGEPRHRGNV